MGPRRRQAAPKSAKKGSAPASPEHGKARRCRGGALASRASAASEPSVATRRAALATDREEELADDACAHRHGHHLRAVARAELAGDTSEVALDRERGQTEGLADLLVGAAVGDEAKYL